MRIHPVFNAILATVLIISVPVGILIGGGPGSVYIWNAYYLAMFILEIISIAKHIKINSAKSQMD
jgi:hypothetical protein